jgi:exodeoxyribonuclease VII small subunit
MVNPTEEKDGSIDALSYEEAFSQLEDTVAALESGEQSLEDMLALYERGRALAQRCAWLLDQAELRVKVISGEELVDFEGESQ